jgi:hypothetical protein
MIMTAPMPGGITVTREALYALYPDLDARLLAHIEAWRESVPVGTAVTVDKMLNCSPDCGCPPDLLLHACKGPRPFIPLEVVMDHLAPQDGVCALPGVKVLRDRMPFWVMRTG